MGQMGVVFDRVEQVEAGFDRRADWGMVPHGGQTRTN